MAKLFAVLISSLRLFQSRLTLNFNEFVPNLCDLAEFPINCFITNLFYRTRDCKKMETFLHCTSQPIIEASTGMKFGCYQYSYPELQGMFNIFLLFITVNVIEFIL